MKKPLKAFNIISVAVAALMMSLVLAGCGTTVDLVEYSDGESYHLELTLNVKNETRVELERTASERYAGKNWTISDYVAGLAERLTFSDGSRFEFVVDGVHDGNFFIMLERILDMNADSGSDDGDDEPSTDSNYKVERKNYFYVYKTEVSMSNPFNGYRTQYDTASPEDNNIMSILKCGLYTEIGGTSIQVYPSLSQAFPAIEGKDVGHTVMTYSRPGAKFGASSGENRYIEGQIFYSFERLLDNREEVISYMYYSPNPLGWYLTAIAAGVLITGLILLVTMKRKNKNKISDTDLFPYDPSEQSGDGNNLPGGYNGDKFSY